MPAASYAPFWLAAATATTNAATLIAARTARLNGTVNRPTSVAATYWFEYGPTAALGTSTVPVVLGAATGSTAAQADVSALSRKKTYHFRLVVDSGGAVTYGSILTFTTLPETIANLVTKFDGASIPADFTTQTGVTLDTIFNAVVVDATTDILSTPYEWDVREQSFVFAVSRGADWELNVYTSESFSTRRVRVRRSGNQTLVEEITGLTIHSSASFSVTIQTYPWYYIRFTHASSVGWKIEMSEDRITWINARTIAITNAPEAASKVEFSAPDIAPGTSCALLAINDLASAPGPDVAEPFDSHRYWVWPHMFNMEVVAGALQPTSTSDGRAISLPIDLRGTEILWEFTRTSGAIGCAAVARINESVRVALEVNSSGNLTYLEGGAYTTIGAYNSVAHRWVGLRFGLDSTVTFLSSPDGTTMTEHATHSITASEWAEAWLRIYNDPNSAGSILQIVGNDAPIPLPSATIGTPTRTRISSVTGFDDTTITWSSSTDFTGYQWRVVSSASDPVTSGVQVEINQNPTSGGSAGTQYSSVITDDEILAVSPAEGPKILKLFLQNANGWST